MNRRGFLKAMLAAGAAPAVVSSGVLMPISSRTWHGWIDDVRVTKGVARYSPNVWHHVATVMKRDPLTGIMVPRHYLDGVLVDKLPDYPRLVSDVRVVGDRDARTVESWIVI